jgi:NTE family protein
MTFPAVSRVNLAVLALSLVFLAPMSIAAPCDRLAAKSPGRPKVGLVLGGGGARGAAHIGVLKVLEQMNVPIDCIAGNSMGAIVGGLYAAGLSPEEIEREMVNMDWDDVLDDKPPRPEQQFRRKRDDDNYLVKKYVGYENGKLELPLGYIQGQKFDLELARLTRHVSGVPTFDELPIPFRAVATDVETGEMLILDSGNLARSIRASMAVPGAFDAVEIEGRLLVDGLVSNNVPVDVARAMGADVLIVVDVGTPLLKRDQIDSLLKVIDQMSNILSNRNVKEQLRTLTERDVYIHPDLGDLSTSDFKRTTEAIAIGEQTARVEQGRLSTLLAGLGSASAGVVVRMPPPRTPPVIAFVDVSAETAIGQDVLLHPFQPLVGKVLDDQELKLAIEELYGWNIFESVRYEVVQKGGKQGLLIHVKEKSWGPNYIQLGVALASDLNGDSSWNIGASLLKTALNRYAGEARLAAQIGDSPLVFGEFYQPLGVALRWFVNPKVFYNATSISRFEGDDEVEEFRVHRYGGDLAVGRTLSHWGEVRVGLRRFGGEADVRIGDPASADFDFDSAEAYARLQYDKVDNRNFPHSGAIASLEWLESVEDLGADKDFSQLIADAGGAKTWGRNTIFGAVEFHYTADEIAPVQNRFRTGGFTRLSGFVQDELSGQQVLLLRSGFYRRIGNIEWLPAYVGMSLEYGNVYEDRDDISLETDDALLAASLFFGVDTILGPVYMAYGHAEQGHDSVYLYLGRLF